MPARPSRSMSRTRCRIWRSQTCGERILFLTSLGSTETAPFAISRMWESSHGRQYRPAGARRELKLVPNDGKLEARFKGPNITPGYWRQPELTGKAFDEEGFYKIGDALKFEDENDPSQGLLFDGRIAEDFKLAPAPGSASGALRAQFIDHCAPYVRDVVIAGADRDDIAVLVVPGCRGLPQLSRPTCRRPRRPRRCSASERARRIQRLLDVACQA